MIMFWNASPLSGRRLFQSLLCLRGTIASATASQAGVEQVSERVSEHVGAPDDDEQGKPWPERQRRNPLLYLRPSQLSIPPQLATSWTFFIKQLGLGGSVAWHQDGVRHWESADWDEGIHVYHWR